MSLRLKNTEILTYLGLPPRVLAEEFARHGGPSYKTILRVIAREVQGVRSNTLARMEAASTRFYSFELPGVLGAKRDPQTEPAKRELPQLLEDEAELFYALLGESFESDLCNIIAHKCGPLARAAMAEGGSARKMLYNLCVWHGAEYVFYSPHDIDSLVLCRPSYIDGKATLPLRRWAQTNVKMLSQHVPEFGVDTLASLAAALDLNKQDLNRYMNARSVTELPRFSTMKGWSERLKGEMRPNAIRVFMLTLASARALHHYYLDLVQSGDLTEAEVMALFGLSERLRAIWPSILTA